MSDYEVGYGKPPIEYRWGKGESGNPSGRRRQTHLEKSSAQIVEEVLSQKVTVTIDGKKRRITLYEMALRNCVMSMVKDPRHFYNLLGLKEHLTGRR